jgi:hypothetical protein
VKRARITHPPSGDALSASPQRGGTNIAQGNALGGYQDAPLAWMRGKKEAEDSD